MPEDDIALLEQQLASLGLAKLAPSLMDYLDLLQKWNAAYNLTAIRDKQAMITKHLLDSLSVLPWIKGERILDVGSGAGFPGIPLALAAPHWDFVLLDSNGKKIRFLQAAVQQLQLTNVTLVQSRVESYRPDKGFDTVVSRAFSNVAQMLHWTKHLLKAEGRWVAMKGRYPEDELKGLEQAYKVVQYEVAGLDSERCCVLIDNTN